MAAERKVTVFGTGAVGGYMAGKGLGGASARVTLLCRPAVAAAIDQHGLVVREGDDETMRRFATATSPDDLSPCDLVVLTVRTDDVAASVPDVRRLMGDRGLVVAFQNGVGTETELAEALGSDRVLAGSLTVSTGMEEPGIITRFSRAGGIALATMDGSPVPTWVVDMFAATQLPTITIADWRSLRWSKLLLNMVAAATSAILDMDIADLLSHPDMFRIEQLAIREAGRVMDALGVKTVSLPGYPAPMLRLAMRAPRPVAQRLLAGRMIRARQGRSPGARKDIARGRSEIPYFNGAIAREGRQVDIRTPMNDALADLTAALIAHPDQRDMYRGQPEMLAAYVRERGIRL